MNPAEIQAVHDRLLEQTSTVIVGQEENLRLLFVALLAEGHVLLEGPPGVAKTLLVRTFSRGLDLDFGRIQFTPDMMPGDILGTNIYDFQSSSFQLTRGPIFTQMLLATGDLPHTRPHVLHLGGKERRVDVVTEGNVGGRLLGIGSLTQ